MPHEDSPVSDRHETEHLPRPGLFTGHDPGNRIGKAGALCTCHRRRVNGVAVPPPRHCLGGSFYLQGRWSSAEGAGKALKLPALLPRPRFFSATPAPPALFQRSWFSSAFPAPPALPVLQPLRHLLQQLPLFARQARQALLADLVE